MSCLATQTRFRLLDRTVGWDQASVEGLTGLDSADGIRLAGDPAALSESDIDPYIPPPVLAKSLAPEPSTISPRMAPELRKVTGVAVLLRSKASAAPVPLTLA